MCVAYPGRVLSVADGHAVVDVRGRPQRVILLALDGGACSVGDWLLVQSGLALGRLDPAEAQRRTALLSGGQA